MCSGEGGPSPRRGPVKEAQRAAMAKRWPKASSLIVFGLVWFGMIAGSSAQILTTEWKVSTLPG